MMPRSKTADKVEIKRMDNKNDQRASSGHTSDQVFLIARLEYLEKQMEQIPQISRQLKNQDDVIKMLTSDNELFRKIQQKLLDDTILIKSQQHQSKEQLTNFESDLFQKKMEGDIIQEFRDQKNHIQQLQNEVIKLRNELMNATIKMNQQIYQLYQKKSNSNTRRENGSKDNSRQKLSIIIPHKEKYTEQTPKRQLIVQEVQQTEPHALDVSNLQNRHSKRDKNFSLNTQNFAQLIGFPKHQDQDLISLKEPQNSKKGYQQESYFQQQKQQSMRQVILNKLENQKGLNVMISSPREEKLRLEHQKARSYENLDLLLKANLGRTIKDKDLSLFDNQISPKSLKNIEVDHIFEQKVICQSNGDVPRSPNSSQFSDLFQNNKMVGEKLSQR